VTTSGHWIVKLRMTSSSLSPDELTGRLVAAARGLVWPPRGGSGAVAAVAECGSRLPAGAPASQVQPEEAVRSAAARALTAAAHDPALRPVCFDRQEQGLGIYQEADRSDGYLLALGDNGRFARIRAVAGAEGVYAVEYYDLDAAYVAAFFRGVPTPTQALRATEAAMNAGQGLRVEYLDPEVRPDASGAVPVT
jgi:hypothetical protein